MTLNGPVINIFEKLISRASFWRIIRLVLRSFQIGPQTTCCGHVTSNPATNSTRYHSRPGNFPWLNLKSFSFMKKPAITTLNRDLERQDATKWQNNYFLWIKRVKYTYSARFCLILRHFFLARILAHFKLLCYLYWCKRCMLIKFLVPRLTLSDKTWLKNNRKTLSFE